MFVIVVPFAVVAFLYLGILAYAWFMENFERHEDGEPAWRGSKRVGYWMNNKIVYVKNIFETPEPMRQYYERERKRKEAEDDDEAWVRKQNEGR